MPEGPDSQPIGKASAWQTPVTLRKTCPRYNMALELYLDTRTQAKSERASVPRGPAWYLDTHEQYWL